MSYEFDDEKPVDATEPAQADAAAAVEAAEADAFLPRIEVVKSLTSIINRGISAALVMWSDESKITTIQLRELQLSLIQILVDLAGRELESSALNEFLYRQEQNLAVLDIAREYVEGLRPTAKQLASAEVATETKQ